MADTELDPDDEDEVARSEAPTWMQRDLAWLGEKRGAVVVDLPGADAIRMGLVLGQRGFRPVFAINTTSFASEIIKMKFVLRWLRKGALYRSAFSAGAGAPPAFILDSRRRGGRKKPSPGNYDNRWSVFASDLPSAKHLRARGIDSVTLIQEGVEPLADLRAIADAYRRLGLEVRVADVVSETLSELTGEPRGWLGFALSQVARRFTSGRRWDGSYGQFVRHPSHG